MGNPDPAIFTTDEKPKESFAPLGHTHSAGEITDTPDVSSQFKLPDYATVIEWGFSGVSTAAIRELDGAGLSIYDIRTAQWENPTQEELFEIEKVDADALTTFKDNVFSAAVTGATSALNFSGTSQYVDFGDVAIVDGATKLSIVYWVYINSTQVDSALPQLLSKFSNAANNRGWVHSYYSTGKIDFNVYKDGIGSNRTTFTTSNAVPTDQWIMVGIRWEASTQNIDIFINGSEVGSADSSSGTPPTEIGNVNAHMMFGALWDRGTSPDDFLTGKGQEVGMWDIALTDNDFSDYYNSGLGIVLDKTNNWPTDGGSINTGLQGLWHFNEDTGTNIADDSDNSNNGTVTGATWVEGHIGENVPGEAKENTIFQSQDGISAGEFGAIELGADSVRCTFNGITLRFNIDGVEAGQVDASSDFIWNTTVQAEHLYSTDDAQVDGALTAGYISAGTITDGTWSSTAGVHTGIVSLNGSGTIDLEDNLDGTGFRFTGDFFDGTALLSAGTLQNIVNIKTAATDSLNIDCGGDFRFRDVDGGFATRLTITSANGNVAMTGTLTGATLITTAGTVQAEHLYSTDDAQIDDTLTMGGNIIMPEDGWIGIGAGLERFQFDGTAGDIVVKDADLEMDGNSLTSVKFVSGTGPVLLTSTNYTYMSMTRSNASDVNPGPSFTMGQSFTWDHFKFDATYNADNHLLDFIISTESRLETSTDGFGDIVFLPDDVEKWRIQAGGGLHSDKIKMTPIGGYAIKLTNKTGGNTVQGQLVKADTATDDGVILTAAGDTECFGVFLDSGVAADAEAWVIVSGIADVAMEDDTAATHGNWVETSDTEAGYADATGTSPAPAPAHFEEIGHCIESVSAGGGGTHILARCVLHFN